MLIEELIKKYRTNTLTPCELEEMRRLITSLPPAEVIRAMDAVAGEDDDPDDSLIPQEVVDRVRNNLSFEILTATDREEGDDSIDHYKQDDPVKKWKIMSMAAMIIGLVAIALSVFFATHTSSLITSGGYTEISTGFGEKSRVILPDGSVVNLAGRTTLRYPSDLALGNRTVEFDGEAYFDISKDSRHPFIVNSDGISIKVTGTSFNIYSRGNSKSAEVILDKGSVTVSNEAGESVCIAAGESVVYDKSTSSFDIAVFRSNPMLRRRVFGIRYDSISPEELIKNLEEKYEVSISNEIATAINSPFTGVLPDDDINETLSILSKVYGFTIPYNRDTTSTR